MNDWGKNDGLSWVWLWMFGALCLVHGPNDLAVRGGDDLIVIYSCLVYVR